MQTWMPAASLVVLVVLAAPVSADDVNCPPNLGAVTVVGLEVLDNVVGSDVQAFSNTGGVVIADNSIDGNLQCKSNVPAPAGGNNIVRGNAEDQCADLRPESGSSPAPAPTTPGGTVADSGGPGGSSGGGSFGLLGAALTILALMARYRPRRRAVSRRPG